MSDRGMGDACVAVPITFVFPALLPCEPSLSAPLAWHALAEVSQGWTTCKKYLASLPQSDFFVFVAMMFLATA